MRIEINISDFLMRKDENVIVALNKISQNAKGFVFVTDEHGVMEGVLTDGDFRRWAIKNKSINLEIPIINLINKNFLFSNVDDDSIKINAKFNNKIKFLPLLNSRNQIKAIAFSDDTLFRIGDRKIGKGEPCFIIAEIGINHNGNKQRAKDLIDAAVDAGADCVKFQMRNFDELYGRFDENAHDIGSQYLIDLLRRFELPVEDMYELFDYSIQRSVLPLCTPWDSISLANLESYGMLGYKVASADFTNHVFLKQIAKTRKPMLISCGMSSELEIKDSLHLLNETGTSYALLHCNSTYPAPYKDVNLNYLNRMYTMTTVPIGYSGHERGFHIPIAAVAMGAKIIEKHFTLDKALEGNDHKVSLLPSEFKQMVTQIRELESAMGEEGARVVTQGEMMNRHTLSKSLILNRNVSVGEVFSEDSIDIKSPGKGLQPNRLKDVIGKKAKKNYKTGDYIYESDIVETVITAKSFKFTRPWGVPVRYHDFNKLIKDANPDFLEFHLSYKDLELNLKDYFSKKLPYDLIVHSPDLFEGDHLLDISNRDLEHRNRSIKELERTIEVTKRLRDYFEVKNKTLIVASVGGFTVDRFLTEKERNEQYAITGEILDRFKDSEVEIIPQTLPPFPWYFGGQLFLNLFVNAEDTVEFCKNYGHRVCLDISHSKLASTHSKYSFEKFVEKVAPWSAHLHIVDAAGVDSEGLQIDEGEIDFNHLVGQLNRLCPKASFIPEIWQGHKNDGEGFWIALDRLSKHSL